MAFFSSSSFNSEVQITKEQFYSFHNIDRKLFTRLTLDLGRDPSESSQVMAFWMWLENSCKANHFIHRALNTLPDTLLHIMVDESCMVFNVVEHEEFPIVFEYDFVPHDIPILQKMTNSGVTLKFFHKNRLSIIRGLTLFLNNVCLRAFEDLYITTTDYQNKATDPITTIRLQPEPQNYERRFVQVNKYYNPFLVGAAIFDAPIETIGRLPPPPRTNEIIVNNNSTSDVLRWDSRVAVMTSSLGAARSPPQYLHHGFANPHDLSNGCDILNNEIENVLSCLSLHDEVRDRDDACSDVRGDPVQEEVPDDRTIFLTFSKGYPLSEKEVKEFFTRKYGDFFDAIHMQEVYGEDKQPLYARLVVRSASFIQVVLEGQTKAKFSINGKHVWARKYVKKNAKGEQSSPKSAPNSQS